MAHHMEPMDVDMTENKENSFVQNNVQATEKGHEELDGSEINMRLRYSMTPNSSPMSKSYSMQCPENDENKAGNGNPNLTRSLNTTVNGDLPKTLPLQVLNDSTDDPNRTVAVLRSIDSVISDGADVTVAITHDSDASFPSSSSSAACTPEATTPTKEIPKPQGSPIMRGLKTVLNIFRTPQNPIPPDENELEYDNSLNPGSSSSPPQVMVASTPLITYKRDKEHQVKNPKESIAFKDDLEKQLLWNDDDTIIFTKKEKIPIHMLLYPPTQPILPDTLPTDVSMAEENNVTMEAMDISYNNSMITLTTKEQVVSNVAEHNASAAASEKDESVFLDCESMNETQLLEGTLPVNRSINILGKVRKSLNDTSILSMKLAETSPAIQNIATEESQDTVNALIVSQNSQILHDSEKPAVNPNKTCILENHQSNKVEAKENTQKAESQCDETQVFKDNNNTESKEVEFSDVSYSLKEPLSNIELPTIDPNVTQILENNNRESMTVELSNEANTDSSQKVIETGVPSKHEQETLISDGDNTRSENTLSANAMLSTEIEKPELNKTINQTEQTPEIIEKSTDAVNSTLPDEQIKGDTTVTTSENQINVLTNVYEAQDVKKASPIPVIDSESANTVTQTVDLTSPASNVTVDEKQLTDNEKPLESSIKTFKEVVIKNQEETNQAADIILKDKSMIEESLAQIQVVSEVNDAINEENENRTESTIQAQDETSITTSDQNIEYVTEKDFEKPVTEMNESVAPAMVLSFINITDDAVVISTPNNKTIQVPNTTEDITMVDDDFLLRLSPADEINVDDLEDIKDKDQYVTAENAALIVTQEKILNETKENIDTIDKESINDNQVIVPECQEPQKAQDDEIFVSESSSPYVSLKPDDDVSIPPVDPASVVVCVEEDPLSLREKQNSSPPITSRGYNFNFDEMDDPFATKTKISLSPPRDGNKTVFLDATFEPIDKIRSPNVEKSVKKPKSLPKTKPLNVTATENKIKPETFSTDAETISNNLVINQQDYNEAQETSNETVVINDESQIKAEKDLVCQEKPIGNNTKETSSSEQSTYFSLGSSTGELVEPKLTIPVFDEDSIINPFTTVSKMRLSPPPSETIVEAINNALSQDNVDVDAMDIDKANNLTKNISHTLESSRETDEKNDTVREINTEDEDTMEGPFIEAALTNETDNFADFESEKVDIDDFKSLPAHVGVENPESGEMFIDAEAFEFLMNQNRSNKVADSGRESLFLKFDPLFAKKINSDGVLNVLAQIQKRQSTSNKLTPKVVRDSIQFDGTAGPSNTGVEADMIEVADELNMMPQKPTMVVPPAVNPVAAPRPRPTTSTRPQRRSMTFTSPAMAVIDRLLSLSPDNMPAGIDNYVLINAEREEADRALAELRQLLAEKEQSVHHLRCESGELRDRLMTMQSQLLTLEAEGEKRLKSIDELQDRLTEKSKLNKNMEAVVEEYERTIAGLIAETEADKKRHADERIQLINERDEQTAHLASMEVAFSDLHSKYQKSKQIIFSYKAKEDEYTKSIQEFEDNLTKVQNNYELLKQHATSKLNHANLELEKINKAHQTEVLKYNAMIKRKDLQITSLEETLAQKTKANEELSSICDELLNRVG